MTILNLIKTFYEFNKNALSVLQVMISPLNRSNVKTRHSIQFKFFDDVRTEKEKGIFELTKVDAMNFDSLSDLITLSNYKHFGYL